MSVAVLCDIHGNLPALDAVLARAARGPAGQRRDRRRRRRRADARRGAASDCARLPWPVHWLRGNADRALVMSLRTTRCPRRGATHPICHRGRLDRASGCSRADRDFLDALPPLVRLTVAGLGDVLFCHGTPRSDEERVTVFTPDERAGRGSSRPAARRSSSAATPIASSTARSAAGGWSTPAASAGPYEHEPGAYWLRLGPGVQLRHTPYDTAAATERFTALGYPEGASMLAPVDPDAVAERFEAASGEPVEPESLT